MAATSPSSVLLRRTASAPSFNFAPQPHQMDRGTKLTLLACAVAVVCLLYLTPARSANWPGRSAGWPARLAASGPGAGGGLVGPAGSSPATLSFVALGDFGVGSAAQRDVADLLGARAQIFRPDFIVSMGDNFYPRGVEHAHDAQFLAKFEHMYEGSNLQIPWYMALGNHDCWGNVEAQVAYSSQSLRWRLPSRYYVHDHSLGADTVRIITLDACQLVCGDMSDVRCEKKLAHNVNEESKAAQYAWLDRVLETDVRWKIVVAHWPIFSVFGNGPTACLQRDLLPRLQKHGVHIYFSGHDHSLQHIKLKDAAFPHFFVSGGGGYELHPGLKPEAASSLNQPAALLFGLAEHGFFEVSVMHSELRVTARLLGFDRAYEAVILHPSMPHQDTVLNPQY